MSQEIVKSPQKPLTLRQQLAGDYFKQQVALALPKHMTPDRFVRVALTALMKTPKLADCTPESVIMCMLNCSALGIEPDGRRAHLIPYGNTCTLIVDFKGLVELAKRSGDVANVFAQIVCEKDSFEWENGNVTHRIDWKNDRGGMYAAYATIVFKDGTKQSDVMTKTEIEAIRKRSKASGAGPWVTDFNEMAKKTVFRRASKWITLSPEMADAFESEDRAFSSVTAADALAVNKPDFGPAIQIAPQDDDIPMGDSEPVQPSKPRGRPPGSVNKPKVEPEQPQEGQSPFSGPETPETPPAPPADAPAAKSQVNYLKGIRGMLKLGGIEEAVFLEFLRETRGLDDSLASLEEVAMMAPLQLEQAYNMWPIVEKAIKAVVK